MTWIIALVMLVLWVLSFVSSYTIAGLIHFFLVLTLLAGLVRIIERQRVV